MMDWRMYTEEEKVELWPIYERLRYRGLHWGLKGFDMETPDSAIFTNEKWRYRLKEVPSGYGAMVTLHLNPGELDCGMGEGRLPEIAILKGLVLAIENGFAKGEVSSY
ncbi:MAG: hypothetical protein ACR2OE_08255 [Thermomicrobiales bacterium]